MKSFLFLLALSFTGFSLGAFAGNERCDQLVKNGNFRFPADIAEMAAEVYRMPRDENLRNLFITETNQTKSKLASFFDPSFRKLFVETRNENKARAQDHKLAPEPENESVVNGLTFKWGNADSFLPDFEVFDENQKLLASFAVSTLALPVAVGESLTPLHLSPDHQTFVLALGSEFRDQGKLFFFHVDAAQKIIQQSFILNPAFFTFAWYGSDAGFWTKDNAHYFIATQGDAQQAGRLLRFDRMSNLTLKETTAYQNEKGDLYLDLQAASNRKTMTLTAYHYGRFFASQVYELSNGKLVYDSTALAPVRNRLSVALSSEQGFVTIESKDYHHFLITPYSCDAGTCTARKPIANHNFDPVLASIKDYTLGARASLENAFFFGFQNRHPVLLTLHLKSGEFKIASLPEGSDASFSEIQGSSESPLVAYTRKNILQQAISGTYDYTTDQVSESKPSFSYESSIDHRDIVAKSDDGTQIPVTLFYQKGKTPSKQSRMMVYLYGEYGTPTFADWYEIDAVIPLVKRDWVVAFPHLRGSMDYGFNWYLNGTRENKFRGFADAASSLRALHALGISNPDRTAIKGESAGGLMISMLTAHAPELFKVGFFEWPSVDLINGAYLLKAPIDSKNRFAAGDPSQPNEFEYACRASGIQIVDTLPARNRLWITTSFGDTNVVPQPPYAFYKMMKAKYPNQVYFYGSASGDHLSHSSDDEMFDFLTLQLSWAESELK